MKGMKKILALVIALMVVLSMSAAFAADPTNNSTTSAAPTLATANDIGVAGTWTEQDTEIVQAKTINIKKELLSYNATSTSVYAPAFSYTYTVKPATVSNLTVTDQETDHESNTAVVAPVNAGITTGLKVNNGTAGNATQATGTLAFTNTTSLTTSPDGASNLYDITLDFTDVTFTKPGVYRYEIEEGLANSAIYDSIDVEDGGSNIRYLDVYVDGELKIYGYVCMADNDSVTPSTVKTNGFVSASNGADKYYTYDLTLSKEVVNDNAGKAHAFPFTVFFNNTANFETTFAITETVGTGSTGFAPAAGNPTWSGVAKVKEGGNITYSGIPAGVDVDVYETNDLTGISYTVVTTVNEIEGDPDNNVSWGAAPTTAVAQTEKAAYESTKATVDTAATETIDAQTLKITNTLLLISPTGVVLRFAPYIAMLVAGVALFIILGSKRRKNNDD